MERSPTRGRAITGRQRMVLEFVASGCTNKEIAERLDISVAGAKKHLESLFRHYGVRNRAELIGQAARAGALHARQRNGGM